MKLSFFLPLFQKAETEELARKVEALTAENMASRSELNQLNEKSDKLRGANAALLVGYLPLTNQWLVFFFCWVAE